MNRKQEVEMCIREYIADIKGTTLEPLKSQMISEMKDLEKELAFINGKLSAAQTYSEAFLKALEDVAALHGDSLISKMKNLNWEEHFSTFRWDYVHPELHQKMMEILKNQ